MRQDPAIGDGDLCSPLNRYQLVRPNPVGLPFTGAPKPAADIIKAQHAFFVVEGVFGGDKSSPVMRENPMAEKVPGLRRRKRLGDQTRSKIEREREGARPPRKDHCQVVLRRHGDRMAPARQIDRVKNIEISAKTGHDILAVLAARAAESDRHIARQEGRSSACGQKTKARARHRLDKGPAINLHRAR